MHSDALRSEYQGRKLVLTETLPLFVLKVKLTEINVEDRNWKEHYG